MKVINLRARYNQEEVLKGISFYLSKGSKVGLVGPNGSGKSTLLKVLASELSLDSGKIRLEDETISYLKQEIPHEYYGNTILEYIKSETRINELEAKLASLENNLTNENMEKYSTALESFLRIDGYSFDNNLESIIRGLNLNKSLDSKIFTLSGGEKIKVLLSTMLLKNEDILLLDEPTNNLDIDAIEWLEKYLITTTKSIIVVSHDEVFLDSVVSKIFEMTDGVINEYNLSYCDYLKQKDIEYEQNKAEYLTAV